MFKIDIARKKRFMSINYAYNIFTLRYILKLLFFQNMVQK